MNENRVVHLQQPDEFDDPLPNILRSGARQLLAQTVEMEAEAFLAAMKDLKLPDGRDRLVRHGYGPTREIQTVAVSRVKIRDRSPVKANGSASPRRSYHFGHGGRRAWMRSCRCSICEAFRRVISKRPWWPCSARTRRICRLQ